MLQKSILKHIKELQQKKYRKEFQECIVEGVKGVGEALNSEWEIPLVIIEGKRQEEIIFQDIIHKAHKKNIPIAFCSAKDIPHIKTTETFSGVMAICAIPQYNTHDIDYTAPILILEKINDPGNLGTIIRTADWFGISNIIVSEGSVDPYNDKVVRSSMGSLFHSTVITIKNLSSFIEKLKEQYTYQINGFILDGKVFEPNFCFDMKKQKGAFVFGSESHGLSLELEKLLDNGYTIPGKGKAESLNIAISAGIVLSKIIV